AGAAGAMRVKGVKGGARSDVRERLCASVVAANGALSLLNLCIYLLDRQMKAQAKAFEEEGGFTERLYRRRVEWRRGQGGKDGA
ncbi:MAG: hypothetical protein HYV26_02405, partial [Candidatus Hydrogenedentes bacterium]|nr:hypothetical protein [Candidatus Hydrogenedentota bacterium]